MKENILIKIHRKKMAHLKAKLEKKCLLFSFFIKINLIASYYAMRSSKVIDNIIISLYL